MRPYNVEIFRPDSTMVGNTNIDSVVYTEDYLSGDVNTITILPIEGVTSEIILKDVKCKKKLIYSKENLIKSIHLLNFDILLVMGAGDIVDLLPQICEEVKKQSR